MKDSWLMKAEGAQRASDAQGGALSNFVTAVGSFFGDLVGGVKEGVVELVDSVTNPSQAATLVLSGMAEPFTSIIDAWIPGEPAQDAVNTFLHRTVPSVIPDNSDVSDSVKDAMDALTRPFMDDAPRYDSFGKLIKKESKQSPKMRELFGKAKEDVNEFFKEVVDDISGNKTSTPPPAAIQPKKTKKSGRRRRRGSTRQRQSVVYHN